jgi:hypothetical protein
MYKDIDEPEVYLESEVKPLNEGNIQVEETPKETPKEGAGIFS